MRKQAVLSSCPVFKLESIIIKAHNSSASYMKWHLREKAESNPGLSVADKTMDQRHFTKCISFFGTHMPLPDTQDHNIIQTLCGCEHWMT